MSARSVLRGLGWLVSELIPAQAVRVAQGRDFDEAAASAYLRDGGEQLANREPNEYEPGLDDIELIGVRGLLQERYSPDCGLGSPPAASAAGSSPAGVDSKLPEGPPAGRHVTVVTDSRREGFAQSVIERALQGDCYDPGADDAAAEWIGKAVAAICEVLAEHRPAVDYTGVYCNTNSDDGPHDYYENWAAWREHVAPLIAEAVAPYWIGW